MTYALARWSPLALGIAWAGVAWAATLPETPVNSWAFIRNDNGAVLVGGDTNSPILGPADNLSPDTLETAAIVLASGYFPYLVSNSSNANPIPRAFPTAWV